MRNRHALSTLRSTSPHILRCPRSQIDAPPVRLEPSSSSFRPCQDRIFLPKRFSAGAHPITMPAAIRARTRGCGPTGGTVNRTWWKLASLALAVALVVPSLVGQAKLTPAELTLKKSLGSPSAPIKLEIFSDYQCPACREMHLNTTRQVIDNYVSTGQGLSRPPRLSLGHAPVLARGRALAERRCRRGRLSGRRKRLCIPSRISGV